MTKAFLKAILHCIKRQVQIAKQDENKSQRRNQKLYQNSRFYYPLGLMSGHKNKSFLLFFRLSFISEFHFK